jgi:hypothetical protein
MSLRIERKDGPMLAFHNDPAIKAKYLARVEEHQKADQIVKGLYWEGGRGCAVGCTLHSSNHAAYETEMGIPEMLARLEDGIFEGLPMASAKLFPHRFLSAIPVGADLSLVGWKFLSWSVELTLKRHGTRSVRDGCKPAIQLLRDMAGGKQITESAAAWAAESAESAARAAAAESARAAAWAAESARAAAWAAWAAAWAAWAAESAESAAAWAAESAESAARAAAESARAAAAWAAAWAAESARAAAAWAAARDEQAKKVLELLAAAPVPANVV